MVHFPQFRFRYLFIQQRILVSLLMGYPIRLPTDHGMFAPPRQFSQLATAFFALIRQGIHLKPFSRLTILLFLQYPSRSIARKHFRISVWSLRSKLLTKHAVFCYPSLNRFFSRLFVK